MKIHGGLKLHPRGFLGAPIEFVEAQVDKPIQVDLIGTASRRVTLGADINLIRPNNEIDDVYKDALKKESILRDDILFRERLFVAALRAFGTFTINDWVEKQKVNPYFDTMQTRFVEETVDYVFTGNRKYHPMIYLDTMAMGHRNRFTVGPAVRSYLFPNNGTASVMSIREFITKWVQQRDGMTDLLISLRTMFGS